MTPIVVSSVFKLKSMSDEELERKGTYFVENNILERYRISFMDYLILDQTGSWRHFIRSRQIRRKELSHV